MSMKAFNNSADLSFFHQLAMIGAIILAGFIIRVINIDQPLVDRWSYRQSDVAMVARNFYQLHYNILFPQIDYGGDYPGYVGMEFPAVPFIAAVLYRAFGEHEAIGRAVSLTFFLLSVPPLFFLVEMVANKRAALLAISIYSLMPLTIFCGRSFTSDMAANSLAMWAVWLFAAWTQDGARWRMFAAAVTASAAILTKAPYVIVGLPMAYLAITKFGFRAPIRRELWQIAALALMPSMFWYFHALVITRANYPNVAFLGHPDYFLTFLPVEKYLEIITNVASWLTPVILLLALTGSMLLRRKRGLRLFHCWVGGMVLLIIFASEDNYRQSWYQLCVTAPIAALAGISADFLLPMRRRPIVAVLVAVGIGIVGYQSSSFVVGYYTPVMEPLRAAGKAVDRLVPPKALVLFASWGDPTAVYYSRRHGWLFYEHLVAPTDGAQAIAMLEMRRRQGASYFLITKMDQDLREGSYLSFWCYLETHFKKVSSTAEFTIFDLDISRADSAFRDGNPIAVTQHRDKVSAARVLGPVGTSRLLPLQSLWETAASVPCPATA
jgi:4-amino-4-deoxy-L-arabinose transferase-like glycosyltransferase